MSYLQDSKDTDIITAYKINVTAFKTALQFDLEIVDEICP